MNSRPPIACATHDYIEVACLYGYKLELQMNDGAVLSGAARNTRTQKGREYVLLDTEQGELEVELNQVSRVQALTDNRYFQVLDLDADRRCGI